MILLITQYFSLLLPFQRFDRENWKCLFEVYLESSLLTISIVKNWDKTSSTPLTFNYICFLTISRYILLLPSPVFVSEDTLIKISNCLFMLFFSFHQQCLAAQHTGTIISVFPLMLSHTTLNANQRLYNYRVPNNQEVYHTM